MNWGQTTWRGFAGVHLWIAVLVGTYGSVLTASPHSPSGDYGSPDTSETNLSMADFKNSLNQSLKQIRELDKKLADKNLSSKDKQKVLKEMDQAIKELEKLHNALQLMSDKISDSERKEYEEATEKIKNLLDTLQKEEGLDKKLTQLTQSLDELLDSKKPQTPESRAKLEGLQKELKDIRAELEKESQKKSNPEELKERRAQKSKEVDQLLRQKEGDIARVLERPLEPYRAPLASSNPPTGNSPPELGLSELDNHNPNINSNEEGPRNANPIAQTTFNNTQTNLSSSPLGYNGNTVRSPKSSQTLDVKQPEPQTTSTITSAISTVNAPELPGGPAKTDLAGNLRPSSSAIVNRNTIETPTAEPVRTPSTERTQISSSEPPTEAKANPDERLRYQTSKSISSKPASSIETTSATNSFSASQPTDTPRPDTNSPRITPPTTKEVFEMPSGPITDRPQIQQTRASTSPDNSIERGLASIVTSTSAQPIGKGETEQPSQSNTTIPLTLAAQSTTPASRLTQEARFVRSILTEAAYPTGGSLSSFLNGSTPPRPTPILSPTKKMPVSPPNTFFSWIRKNLGIKPSVN